MCTEEHLGQPVQPAQQRLELAEEVGGLAVLFDQIRGLLNIGNGQGMGYRLIEQLVLFEPATGPAVEFRNQGWLCLPQTAVQLSGFPASGLCSTHLRQGRGFRISCYYI